MKKIKEIIFILWLLLVSFFVYQIYHRQTGAIVTLNKSISNQDTVKINQATMQNGISLNIKNDSVIKKKIDSLNLYQQKAKNLVKIIDKSPK
jgi:hypothetical protein